MQRFPRHNPRAEKAFLASLPAKEATQIAGSFEKRQRILEGKESLEGIYNQGKDELYKWSRVGDVGQDALMTATKTGANVSNAYEVAKAGGKHAPWYKQQLDLGHRQLQKGIQSIENQIADHQSWIDNPQRKVKDWAARAPRYQAGLLKKWRQDIARQKEQVEILKGVFKEKGCQLPRPLGRSLCKQARLTRVSGLCRYVSNRSLRPTPECVFSSGHWKGGIMQAQGKTLKVSSAAQAGAGY